MKKTLMMAALAMAMAATGIKAQDLPDLYLAGTNFGGWNAQPEYQFTRNGSLYTLTVDNLDGEFKVRGAGDWTYNLGYYDYSVKAVEGSVQLLAAQNGGNFKADNLGNVTITFEINDFDGERLPDTWIQFIVNGEGGQREPHGMTGTLPVLYINIYYTDESGEFILDGNGQKIYNDEVISANLADKDYRSGEYWLDMSGCTWMGDDAKSVGSADAPLPLEMKARGNYTRTAFAKKPFKLKLGKKQNLLGLTPDKSKHWAILAHADDYYGYMRNFTGFSLGQRIELPWTPSQQPVEVVINGDYRGLYFLTESIRVGDGRVPIDELADLATDPALISGGYLVELDNYDEENQIQMEEQTCVGGYTDMLRITWDTPEEYSDIQRLFVADQFTAMNNNVGQCSDELWAYMDLDDAARYYIVEEIVSHTESYHGSTYMYRQRGAGQKWHFSPLWDFGNAFSGPTNDWFYYHSPFGNTWIPSLRQNATFNAKVVATWKWFMNQCYEGLTDDLRAYASHIATAAIADHERWADAPLPTNTHNAQAVADNSDIDQKLTEVLSRLESKISWLTSQWGSYAGTWPEPAADTTPAAPLPPYAQSGLEPATVAVSDMGPAEWFDLQGRPLQGRPSSGLAIERRGENARLVLAR